MLLIFGDFRIIHFQVERTVTNMVYYVNDHLIQDEVVNEGSWSRDGVAEPYKKVIINAAAGAVKRQEDGSFAKITRTICAHNVSLNSDAKTRIVNIIPDGAEDKVRVSIRTSSTNRYDSDVFVVAIPYDGMVLPMEDAPGLNVFRTMILKSDQTSIESEDHKYRRVIYFVVSPHVPTESDGWYPSECDLVVKTARSNVSKNNTETENSTWTVITHTVRFGEAGTFEILKDEEVVPYTQINPNDLRNVKICNLVPPIRFGENGHKGNRSNGNTAMRSAFETAKKAYDAKENGYDDDQNSGRSHRMNNRKRRGKH